MATSRKRRAKTPAAKPRTKKSVRRPRARVRIPKIAKKVKPTPASPAPTTAATPSKSAARWALQGNEVGVRVRMYRVGFGDFFLLTVLTGVNDPVHVVIDCGVFKGTSQTGDLKSIEAAVADMVQITGGKLALIMVTHRHADHIAGFARCAAAFRKLTVQSIWMSVWESQYSATALRFQAELTRTAAALQSHFTDFGIGATPEQSTARKFMENATGAGQKGGSNAAALDLLQHGFAGVLPEFYQAGSLPKLPAAFLQAGITAQILGPPPIADLDLMKLMDLQKGVGQYLAEPDIAGSSTAAPFGPRWDVDSLTVDTAGVGCYGPETYREWIDQRNSPRPLTRQKARAARSHMESALTEAQPGAALLAAKQLNSFLNNQSLVVLFMIKGKKLLFVGDAQAGNWEHWLFDTNSPDKKASGTMTASAQEILTSLDFYKVGHHGSGNATPKAAADLMGARGRRFAAMCSTQKGVYGTEDPDDPTKGTEVPRAPLLAKLAAETAFVRSDQIAITVNDQVIKPAIDAPLPSAASGTRFETGALWIDCFL